MANDVYQQMKTLLKLNVDFQRQKNPLNELNFYMNEVHWCRNNQSVSGQPVTINDRATTTKELTVDWKSLRNNKSDQSIRNIYSNLKIHNQYSYASNHKDKSHKRWIFIHKRYEKSTIKRKPYAKYYINSQRLEKLRPTVGIPSPTTQIFYDPWYASVGKFWLSHMIINQVFIVIWQ